MNPQRNTLIFAGLGIACLLSFGANLWWGSIHIPAATVWHLLMGDTCPDDRMTSAWRIILIESRLPASVTALLTGAALAVSGLLLQSYFRNPLAGPSILGITSGANLGVAVVVLMGIGNSVGITLSAIVGALLILGLLLLLSRFIRQSLTLLIVGILVSYFAGAVITLLNYYATAEGVHSFLIWGMGDFSGVGPASLPLYAGLLLGGLALSTTLVKPLNAWMLGSLYACNLGISPGRTRWLVLLSTGLLAAITTAYCGPIAFIGLSIPHVARLLFRTDDHRVLLPSSALLGALCAALCLLLSTLPASGRLIPINAITPLFGVPIILYILLRRRQ